MYYFINKKNKQFIFDDQLVTLLFIVLNKVLEPTNKLFDYRIKSISVWPIHVWLFRFFCIDSSA